MSFPFKVYSYRLNVFVYKKLINYIFLSYLKGKKQKNKMRLKFCTISHQLQKCLVFLNDDQKNWNTINNSIFSILDNYI